MNKLWIIPKAGTGNDRAALQSAIDEAAAGCGNVRIPQGIWVLDESLLLPERIHVHLDGAHLIQTAQAWIFQNSRAYDPFANNRVGGQRGIVLTGENNAVLEGPCAILLRNSSRFLVEGLTFAGCSQYAVSLAFSFQGKLRDLRFRDCLGAVECCAGVRDCLFEQMTGNTQEAFILFDDTRRREMGVYYYGSTANDLYYSNERDQSWGFTVRNELMHSLGKGYAVSNHILRDIHPLSLAEPFQINGTLCQNILSV